MFKKERTSEEGASEPSWKLLQETLEAVREDVNSIRKSIDQIVEQQDREEPPSSLSEGVPDESESNATPGDSDEELRTVEDNTDPSHLLEGGPAPPADSVPEVEGCHDQIAGLEKAPRREKGNAEESQEKCQRLAGELTQEREKLSGLEASIQEKENWIQRIETEKTDVERKCTEILRSKEAELSQLRLDLENSVSACEVGFREIGGLRENAKLNERLSSLIWPSFLATSEFDDWRKSLTAGLFAEPPSSTVVGIVTCLFSYNALRRLPEQGSKRLIDVVHDLGTSLYLWFEESGLDPEASFQIASLWAESINLENEGSLSIVVPEPDTPFDRRTMVSYESKATASPDVGGAKSWCIKDSDGRIQKQATVILT